MTSGVEPPIRCVMSFDGNTWKTNAHGAADYLFNPVFMSFFLLCVVLYATMMQPAVAMVLPVVAQVVIWFGLLMISLLWLFLGVWLSVIAHDRGYLPAIYTPLILLPLVGMNAVIADFVLSAFSGETEVAQATFVEGLVRNTIILVAFDIMHARFVAPQHPRYVPSSRDTKRTTASLADKADIGGGAIPPRQPDALAEGYDPETVNIHPSNIACPKVIEVAREHIDATAIVWIKSEDHYLNFRLEERNLMLRGKLRSAVSKLGDDLGCQINRSVWVAFDAIRKVDDPSTGLLEVHMNDDTVYRVASSRRLVFLQNYDRFKGARDGLEVT